MRRSTLGVGLLLLLGGVLCLPACERAPSDTGFTGTWERSLDEGYSSLAIREVDEGYRVRWSKLEGNQAVRCDDEGLCSEFVGTVKVYEWRFRTFERPDSDDLFVEVAGTPVEDGPGALRYTDRLVLQPGGIELWSYQIEQDGSTLDPPAGPVKFRKISDTPL